MAFQGQKLVTVSEFDVFISQVEQDEKRFELINGAIVEKVPTQLHALIAALLSAALVHYLREHPIGWAFVEARYGLPDDEENARIPDVSLVLKVEGRDIVEDGSAPYMPDLAVEIQSPGQSDKLVVDKAEYYLANGTQMVWLVYPTKKLVELLTKDDRQLLTLTDTLRGGTLLPDFSLPVKDIFAR